jgi:hypothetical protein
LSDGGSANYKVLMSTAKTGQRLYYSLRDRSAPGHTAFMAQNNWDYYPGSMQVGSGARIAQLAVYACTNEADVNTAIHRLIQIGIDQWRAYQLMNNTHSHGAGYGQGRAFPIVFAGWMLGDTDMQNAMFELSGEAAIGGGTYMSCEGNSFYHSTNGFSGYRMPRPRSSYPDGIPLFGDPGTITANSVRDQNGVYDGCGTKSGANPYTPYPTLGSGSNDYMNANACFTAPAFALCAHLYGFSHLLPKAYRDFADRWAHDRGLWSYQTTYNYLPYTVNFSVNSFHRDLSYGGSGNAFVAGMWDAYRYGTDSSGKTLYRNIAF